MTVYATHYSDGERINENAAIAAFNTREEAEAYLRAAFEPSENVEIVAGTYGDCWIKTLARPHLHPHLVEPFAADDVRVSEPGTHPGGPFYWLTPWPDVLVAVLRD